jgi:hypothetical protein
MVDIPSLPSLFWTTAKSIEQEHQVTWDDTLIELMEAMSRILKFEERRSEM